jgi:uncharacterized protein (TIGR00251 family)
VKITLYIQPGARKPAIAGKHGEHVKLKIAAPPVEGAANKAVLEFIAEHLEIPRSAVALVNGEKSRVKTIEIDDRYSPNEERLKELI